jgi:hypothetical protein
MFDQTIFDHSTFDQYQLHCAWIDSFIEGREDDYLNLKNNKKCFAEFSTQ